MKSTLIRNVSMLGGDGGDMRRVDILVEKGIVTSVRATEDGGKEQGDQSEALGSRPTAGRPNGCDDVIDGEGRLAVPGFVNGHNHLGMTMLRSYADDLPLWDWLKQKMWPVEDRLTEEDVYLASLVGIAEMLRGGTTTVADIYFHMNGAARAVAESGIRAVLSRGLQGLSGSGDRGLKEAEQFLEHYGGSERMTIMLGPHSPVTCPPDFMKKVTALSQRLKLPLQIHVAETVEEVETIQAQYGVSPVKYLERTGAMECGLIAIHCVHVDDEDIKLLKRYRVPVIHCPTSNLKLGSGIAPVGRFAEAGVCLGLGTDGPASNNDLDMWEEMRLTALLHKGKQHDPTVVPAGEAWHMATQGSAKALGLEGVGELRVGAKADIVLLDVESPHWYPRHNLLGNLVYSGKAADVSLVMVNGKVVLADGVIQTFDEKEILHRLQERARELA